MGRIKKKVKQPTIGRSIKAPKGYTFSTAVRKGKYDAYVLFKKIVQRTQRKKKKG